MENLEVARNEAAVELAHQVALQDDLKIAGTMNLEETLRVLGRFNQEAK